MIQKKNINRSQQVQQLGGEDIAVSNEIRVLKKIHCRNFIF